MPWLPGVTKPSPSNGWMPSTTRPLISSSPFEVRVFGHCLLREPQLRRACRQRRSRYVEVDRAGRSTPAHEADRGRRHDRDRDVCPKAEVSLTVVEGGGGGAMPP